MTPLSLIYNGVHLESLGVGSGLGGKQKKGRQQKAGAVGLSNTLNLAAEHPDPEKGSRLA